jgi:DNA-binding MarR family transcriptional regulator/GNAT superfamily N-acetyltransferase
MLAKSKHLVNALAMDELQHHAQALRAFNRFYTRRMGVLGERLLSSRFTLAESRLLWELAHTPGQTASALARELQLDAGYLSRLLTGLRERGLVKAQRAPHDGRQTLLSLTAAGRRAFAPLERRSQEQAAALLGALPAAQRHEVLGAARRMQRLLGDAPAGAVELRGLLPGDLGWVVSRHGALYAQEYGWDMRFEGLVARICADYIDQLDPSREAAWVAQADGSALGCVFLVQARDEATKLPESGVAQLRLLLVEPAARGRGVGKRLTAQCETFAREKGYTRMRLWTNSLLLAARAIYSAAGYRLMAIEPHHSFGHALVGEVWEKELSS